MSLDKVRRKEFLTEFAAKLKQCSTHIGLKSPKILDRLKNNSGIDWSSNNLSNFWNPNRRGGNPDPLELDPISWAHGIPSYFAGGLVERRQKSEDGDLFTRILPLDPQKFRPNELQHFFPQRPNRPTTSHPPKFTTWPLCVVTKFEFKSGQLTGELPHDAPNHVEIAIGISGKIILEFTLEDDEEPKPYDLSPGKYILFDAGVPHRAYLSDADTTGEFLVITFLMPGDTTKLRLERITKLWKEASNNVKKKFLKWANKQDSPPRLDRLKNLWLEAKPSTQKKFLDWASKQGSDPAES